MNPVHQKLNTTQKLGVLCIFSIFLDKAIRGGTMPFDLYYYYIIFIPFLLFVLYKRGKISFPPSWFNKGILIIFSCSFLVTLYNGLLGYEFAKQVFGIVFTATAYYNVFYVFNFDTERIFHYYLKFAFWVALHGIIDNMLHIAGIHLTPVLQEGPLQFREYGIMGEPFYLAMALTPAVVYYTCYFRRTWQSSRYVYMVIIACYLVTYSSTAVTGLGMSVLASLYINDFLNFRKNKIIFAPLLVVPVIIFVNYLIENVSLINERYNDTTSLFFSSEIDVKEAGKSNSSTFALYSNYVIARDSFLDNPLFGSGLGSHPLIYERTFLKYFPSDYLKGYGAQNQQDANSRFLRLMSETGLVGLIIFLYCVFAFFASKSWIRNDKMKELGTINYAIFTYIILGLIRNGNYINVGFFLFFFLYYFTYKQMKAQNRTLQQRKRFSPVLS